jgi:hypothetical protein
LVRDDIAADAIITAAVAEWRSFDPAFGCVQAD